MKKLLLLSLFILTSFCAYAQNELPGDTTKNRLPVIKEQILSSPKENKNIGTFDESQPQQNIQMESQNGINLQLTPPEYVEPLPWTDMEKIHFKKDIFENDFERYKEFLLSPNVILTMYGNHSTYPTMGSMMQAGAGITYYSPDGRWELSGGIYAANYSMPTPSSLSGAMYAKRDAPIGTQWDLGLNASIAYRINSYMRIYAFGQYSGYGKSNSFHGYMNPMYPQSRYGIVMQVKVTDWLDLNGGMERSYDPTKMKWVTSPIFGPTFHIKK